MVAKLENAGYTIEKTGETTQTNNTTIITRGEIQELIQEDIKQILGVELITNGGQANTSITIIIGKDYEG